MSEALRSCAITGWGTYLPENQVVFDAGTDHQQVRFRVNDGTSQLDMLARASSQAIGKATEAGAIASANDIDCVISACAVDVQPLPSTAALLEERLDIHTGAPAVGIDSSCTSFVTALDVAASWVSSGRYGNVLIASGDLSSIGLNPEQKESYELFSDAAAAVVVSAAQNDKQGVFAYKQQTFPRHAHETEIRGGLTGHHPQYFGDNPQEYMFDMKGRQVLLSAYRVLPEFMNSFAEQSDVPNDAYNLVVPHQASRALGMIMKILKIPSEKYVDIVATHGNMVSAAIPFALCKSLDEQRLVTGEGQRALLCGTAAGLTLSALGIRL